MTTDLRSSVLKRISTNVRARVDDGVMTNSRPFRFGVVAAPRGSAVRWRQAAVRAADLGYATLVMPDGMQLLEPGPALATAAAAADIRVGTWVFAAPLRPPRTLAWEAHSLAVMTDGRFEMGIGTGRPDFAETVRALGLPWGTAQERLAQVSAAIDHLRELDGDTQTPVLMAARGPHARQLAAEKADIVSLAVGALEAREEVARLAADIRARAGRRADELEFAMNLFAVGDDLPPGAERILGANPSQLIAMNSLAVLRGTTQDMVDELQRRRAEFGFSYVLASQDAMEQLAPVVEVLTGR
jgi:alkanesulfonate monooxygenase SsuD/methylene tetrahydromethanopterin reductase-like flavin-dependent oxidoreductase (luciferase family)